MKRRYKFLVLGFLCGVLGMLLMNHWYQLDGRVQHIEQFLESVTRG